MQRDLLIIVPALLLLALLNLINLSDHSIIYRWTGPFILLGTVFWIYFNLIWSMTAPWLKALTPRKKIELALAFCSCSLVILALYSARLSTLPYCDVSDPVRDSPQLARAFIDGLVPNPWGVGYYGGFSKILSMLNVPAELIFPNSNMSFRITGVLVTFLGFAAFFIIACRRFGTPTGSVTALAYAWLPMILWQSRSQVLVALNPFLVMPILAWFTTNPAILTRTSYFKLGMMGGFVAYFHLAAALVWLAAYPFGLALSVLKKGDRWKRDLLANGGLALLGFSLAILPRIDTLEIQIEIARMQRWGPEVTLFDAMKFALQQTVANLSQFTVPSCLHGPPNCIELLPGYYFWIVMSGVAFVVFDRGNALRSGLSLLLYSAASIVIVGVSGFSLNRFIVILPIAMYFFGLCLYRVAGRPLAQAKISRVRNLTSGLVLVALLSLSAFPALDMINALNVYDRRPEYHLQYVSCELAGRMAENFPKSTESVCIATSDAEFLTHLGAAHVHEQIQYYSARYLKYDAVLIPSKEPRVIQVSSTCPAPKDKLASNARFGDWILRIQSFEE